MLHELKIWPEAYGPLEAGRKRHEFRKDDRGFEIGDFLYLREWEVDRREYTGRASIARVTYLSKGPAYGIPQGYCVMSVELLGSRGRGARG
jgi:hypothetical protein